MKSVQEIILWLEQGRGAKWLRWAAVGVCAAFLSAVYSMRQYHGLPDEFVMQQAVVARQLASGEGFTTPVNYPQTLAVMQKRGVPFREEVPYPELHHAPLYPVALGALFAVLPDSAWAHVPQPPDGWVPDYVVLGFNVLMFWLAVALVWRLARRLFDERAAWVSAIATAVAVPLWEQTVAVNGLPLFMVLSLALFELLTMLDERADDPAAADRGALVLAGGLGGVVALLFLAEYSAGLGGLVIAGYIGWRWRGRARLRLLAASALVFTVLALPWLVRNVAVAGNPLGLAWQNLALKAGDTTAEPGDQRNLMTADSPVFDVKKIGNKGLTGLETNLKERVWSGGGLVLTAFFVAGLAYQFRHAPTNRIRWVFAALLLVMLGAQPYFGSGESPRYPAHYLAPLIIVFGAGFFLVLIDSQIRLAMHWKWAAAGLLVVQMVPLVRDTMEPRKIHFHYPPYFPNLFMELRKDSDARFVRGTGISTDVPAGTAWYGRMRVWAKPVRLREFQAIMVEQNIGALLLTPVTLDRPFFTELAARGEDAINLRDPGGWGGVYSGLVTRVMPRNFALNLPPQRLTENMVLLVNPATLQRGGN